MFKGFNREKILETHYRQEIENWDWQSIKRNMEYFEPEDSDWLEENEYLVASWLGSDIHPSGKTYAIWTSNQTRFDELRDEIFREVLETIAIEQGGSINYFSGDAFYVESREYPKVPAVLRNLIATCRADLGGGPVYLNKQGEHVSMFDDDYHHQFDFGRATEIIGNWFEDNAPNAEFWERELGKELYSNCR